MYWRRPASSVPTTWMCPLGAGQIHTCSHAGGITRALHRATSSAPSGWPSLVDVAEPLAPAATLPAGTVGRDSAQAHRSTAVPRRRWPPTAAVAVGGQPKFSKYRLGVGPRWPWYFDPVAPLPYGRSAGVVICMKLIWPIFMPG